MQFVCRMFKLQHDEGRYFLHEHCQSELPWQKDRAEEIQEMTGAKLMSVSQGSCSLPSNEKPTVMVTNCPAIAFTFASFYEGSPPKQKVTTSILIKTSTRASKTCMRIFPVKYSCTAQVEQTAKAGELQRFGEQCFS